MVILAFFNENNIEKDRFLWFILFWINERNKTKHNIDER